MGIGLGWGGRRCCFFSFFLCFWEEIIFGVLKRMKERDAKIGVDVASVVSGDIGRHGGGG